MSAIYATCKSCGKHSEMAHSHGPYLLCLTCYDTKEYSELKKKYRLTYEYKGYVRGDVIYEAEGFAEDAIISKVEVERTIVRDDTVIGDEPNNVEEVK